MGAPCCSGFFKYSSINSKLSEPQMKAKMLPFIQRQGMCLGTPMGPSAAETATASSLPASNPAYPVSKATVEPGDGCTREATGIPQHFHVCPWFPIVWERITSVQIWKLFKHTKCLPRLYSHSFVMGDVMCFSWLFESFCWYSNEQTLFITLLFAFYLVTMTFPPDEDCLRSPLEHDA